jgi:cytochrome c-type biogenesis protein CcmH
VFSPKVKEFSKKLACWCGGCSRLPVGTCACGHCALQKSEIAKMFDEGKSEDQVLDYFVAKYGGQQVLSEPKNEGTGRIVWVTPYVMGFGGAGLALVLALRWSRRRPGMANATGGEVEDADMAARLDDDLRDLD